MFRIIFLNPWNYNDWICAGLLFFLAYPSSYFKIVHLKYFKNYLKLLGNSKFLKCAAFFLKGSKPSMLLLLTVSVLLSIILPWFYVKEQLLYFCQVSFNFLILFIFENQIYLIQWPRYKLNVVSQFVYLSWFHSLSLF